MVLSPGHRPHTFRGSPAKTHYTKFQYKNPYGNLLYLFGHPGQTRSTSHDPHPGSKLEPYGDALRLADFYSDTTQPQSARSLYITQANDPQKQYAHTSVPAEATPT